jgi:hypothetical protein
LRTRGANGIELALQCGDAFDRLRHFRGRDFQERAQIFERAAFLAEGFDGGLVFEGLRRQLAHRKAMLLQLTVGRRDLFGDPLGLMHLFEQPGDALLDLLDAAGTIFVAADLLAEVVEAFQRGVGLLADLVERLAGLRQLRRSARHLRQHGAEHRPFFPGLGDERLELVLLRLLVACGAEKCVKHGGEYSATSAAGPPKRRSRGGG